MSLNILSTKIIEKIGTGALQMGLILADSPEEDTASEILHIHATVSVGNDAYLPALQHKAIVRAKFLLDEVQTALQEKWNNS